MTSIWLVLIAAAGVGIAHSILPDHWVPLAVIARSNRWTMARTAKVSFVAGLGHVAVSLILGVLLAAVGLALRQTIIADEGRIVGGVLVVTGLGFLVWALATRGQSHGHSHPHSHPHFHVHADDPEQPGDGGSHVHSAGGAHHHAHDHGHEHPHGEPMRAHAAGSAAHDHEHSHQHDHGYDHGHGHHHDREHSHDDHDHRDAHDAQHEPTHGRGGWLAEVAVPFGVAASPDLTILPVFLAASAIGVAVAVSALATFAVATLATFVVLTLAATAGGYQVSWPWLDQNGHLVSALVLLVVGILVFVQF